MVLIADTLGPLLGPLQPVQSESQLISQHLNGVGDHSLNHNAKVTERQNGKYGKQIGNCALAIAVLAANQG